jgi:hypothetical protein
MRLAAERAAHEREVCRWLLAAERVAVHTFVGYASLAEYADRVAGLTTRQTEERLRVGRALAGLPVLDGALAGGELSWSAVREITRVAVPRTEQEWLGWARGQRTRDIERAVAERRSGDGPRDRPDPSLRKHRLRFEVRAETMALFRDLQAAVRADLGSDVGVGAVDDDMLLYEIARRALGGPGDDGRAGYQVAVTRCDACGEVSVDAGGETYVVDEAVAEMMSCDCQEIGDVDGASLHRPHEGAAPPVAPSPHAGATPPVTPSPHAGAAPPVTQEKQRASQTIPPATRRRVMRRDHRRCKVDGCRNCLFLDAHHADPRAEGGGHDPERLLILCGNHHRAVHEGTLVIDGNASEGFSFRHADGTPYGEPLRPPAIDVAQQVFSALRGMGFRETHARALIDTVLRQGAPDDVEAFLRAALRASG